MNLPLLKEELFAQFSKGVFHYPVHIQKGETANLSYKHDTKEIFITYQKDVDVPHLLAQLTDLDKDIDISLKPSFENLTYMIDVARNNVYKVSSIKKLIRHLAILGYDTLEIYLEDCFEVNDEPYFGYMRGRYSKEELKDIVKYAEIFGIRVVPCVNVLAHNNAIKHWCVYNGHFDVNDILLVKDERVYQLIENIFQTLSEVFPSKYVNIGMDEAMLIGKGKYEQIHGKEDAYTILSYHLDKVMEIAAKYGFKAEMWGDMFINRRNSIGKDGVRNDVNLIYWDYDLRDLKTYLGIIDDYQKISDHVFVAGGVWKWIGVAPDNSYAIEHIKTLMKASRMRGIKSFILTGWGDNGGECSLFASLPSIYAASNCAYQMNIRHNFKQYVGLDWNRFLRIDHLNQTSMEFVPNTKSMISRYGLYMDPLLGFMDSSVSDEQKNIFLKVSNELRSYKKLGEYSYIFRTAYELAKFLYLKIDLGVNLRLHYQHSDKVGLASDLENIKKAVKQLDRFYEAFYQQWHLESKGNGFDVQDLRLGGLRQRLITASRLVSEYLKGDIDRIDELEEILLDFYGNGSKFYKAKDLHDWSYRHIASINVNE